MRLEPTRAVGYAGLLRWDAWFLPIPAVMSRNGDVELTFPSVGGERLEAMAGWPKSDRVAAALQLVAAATFLFERGWYPSRRLLWGVRGDRGRDGVALFLTELPLLPLDAPGSRRLTSTAGGAGDEVVLRAVAPFLARLVPESRGALETALAGRPSWEAPQSLVGALLDAAQTPRVLRHPDGAGRALWTCQIDLPTSGAVWVADEHEIPRLVAAAELAAFAAGLPVDVVGGEIEEQELLQIVSRAAAAGRDALVFTVLASPTASPLRLADRDAAIWALGPDIRSVHAWMREAGDQAGGQLTLAREVLEAGALGAFRAAPRMPAADRRVERLLPPHARRCLELLRRAPVGLTSEEVGLFVSGGPDTLRELERLALVRRSGTSWLARDPARVDLQLVGELAAELPADSPRRLVCRALTDGDSTALAAQCDDLLDRGRPLDVLALGVPVADQPAIALRCAEAALASGRGGEASAFLERVPPGERNGHWRALSLCRDELVGVPLSAGAFVVKDRSEVPSRVRARSELARAAVARRTGDRQGELAALESAAAFGEEVLPDCAVWVAAARGRDELRALRRRKLPEWPRDTVALALHALGYLCFEDGSWLSAATAYRAALRAAEGIDLDLLGRIHLDLGSVSLLLERPAEAERHLLLAERLFARCGSQRLRTLALGNRAVVACDRLECSLASELLAAAAAGRPDATDSAAWLDALERVRLDLARGDAATARSRLPALRGGLRPFRDRAVFRNALAGITAHLALTEGDLAAAAEAACGADPGERELIEAILSADRGQAPVRRLPRRWGLVTTARLLAAFRRDGEDAALALLEKEIERFPREAAVGWARFAAIVERHGEVLGDDWGEVRERTAAILREADLGGWLERATGDARGALALVRALDGVLNAGTAALKDERIEPLAAAIGFVGVEVARAGEVIAEWGRASGTALEAAEGAVRVRGFGARTEVARATLELLARHLSVRLPALAAPPRGGSPLIGPSPALATVRALIEQWAPLSAPTLILGEPGTGKELVARELYRLSRRRGPFVAVNCAAIPSSLMEGELFGVVRGAFTGADRDRQGLVEAAEGGALFFDEIGELAPGLQAKLLRLLQEPEVRRLGATLSRRVDVRFIAATNTDLVAAMERGQFRQDLYYRLAVGVIEVPPLRQRPADVDALAAHFLARCAEEYNRPGVALAPDTVSLLRGSLWRGNVRELEMAVRRAVAASQPGEVIGPDRFPELTSATPARRLLRGWAEAQDELRRHYFTELLAACDGNRSEAARRAGLSRQALLYHLRALGIGRSGG